jgi:multimeric flavodoxin WrbA
MKVTAFVGSARKRHTYNATALFLNYLQQNRDIEYEIISLNDYHLEVCKGCKLCLDKGEKLCPLKDDRDILIEKINNSDGIVLASPNYSFNVSGLMKVFLDRLGFIFHRPRFFGKTFTSIVVQGVYGGKKISEYFNFIGKGLGFEVVKGCCLNSMEPMTEKDQKAFDKKVEKLSRKFWLSLNRKEYPSPTLFELMVFRMSRTGFNMALNESWMDFRYYRQNGWFETDYYYPVKLNPLKKLAGIFCDMLFKFWFRGKKEEKSANSIEADRTA